MKKYCELKGLDPKVHILEFDADQVQPDETANDLDLDGGEIFDVRQSTKAANKHIEANKKNYVFDDDILTI